MYIDMMIRLASAASSAARPQQTLPSRYPPFSSIKGTFFDAALDFRDPEGEAFTKAVLDATSPFKRTKNKPRAVDQGNRRLIVRKILANAFRCFFYRQPSNVAYFRKADGYDRLYPWLSGRSMSRAVDLITEAGLLESSLGERGTAASTYRITQDLHRLAMQHGVSENSLTYRLPPERLIRLRPEGEKRIQSFAATNDTRAWTALLEAYNSFYREHDVSLPLSAEEELEWAERWNRKSGGGGMPLYRPERFQTDLYRQFNNGSFDEGGRMYGGWWIYASAALRSRITINGQPTAELDYSGCAVRMLYHQRGIEYLEDPYYLNAISEHEVKKGLPPGYHREGIKQIVQALINDRSGGQAEKIKLPNGISFRGAFKRNEVRRMIEEKHAPIVDAFGTGAGLTLQRQDSEIALSVISSLRREGVLALPIHDSFIVNVENRDLLYEHMTFNYEQHMGFNPIIK